MRVAVYAERERDIRTTGLGEGDTKLGTTAGTTETTTPSAVTGTPTAEATGTDVVGIEAGTRRDVEVQDVEWIDMANGWVVGGIGWLVWAFIAGLNVYLIVMLGLGRG